ncbi:hypothetical protein [Kineobactrum salinum]|uniref:Type II secretion system protein GspG C-terminal domain-containing protein n=1 Tax=Kineobactrum salinum TaxID=2708301 RepID=A0A6C0TY48_9GAMM|nr:hypothetical protein [Kineobactrum salinum]QIB64762.1 hypothetical protein G3T16_04540 [Kineobactrum salinum]
MIKWISGAVVVFLIIISMGYLNYSYQENEAYRQMRANCELLQLSILLNHNFDKSGGYPDKQEWLKRNSSEIGKIRCGRSLSINNGSLMDPWGNPYRYHKVSDGSVVLYSVKMEDEALQLDGGELKMAGKNPRYP